MSVTVLLVDDHPIVRQGLRNLLDSMPDFKVVGEAGDGLQALEVIERVQPQVLVIDVVMPGLTGLEVTQRVKRQWPAVKVIILSMQNNEAYVVSALKSGASGYILKDTGPEELVDAIRTVVRGDRYLSKQLSERIINAYVSKVDEAEVDPYDTLTNREKEILHLVAEGYTNQEIAERLFISPRTAELHRSNVLNKLSLKNQVDLVRFAIKRGILPLDQ
jgi:two-component system, NarL family, response regulator NreC